MARYGWKRSVIEIPAFVIEYFLLGKTRADAIERYTQDGGVVTDVWLAFAKADRPPQRVIVAPAEGIATIDLAFVLHTALSRYKKEVSPIAVPPLRAAVSPLENFVALTVSFEELLHVVLPLTSWWHDKQLARLQQKAVRYSGQVEDLLFNAINYKLGIINQVMPPQPGGEPEEASRLDIKVLDAAPVAALIGVFALARGPVDVFADLRTLDPKRPDFEGYFVAWVKAHAEEIAAAAKNELKRLTSWRLNLSKWADLMPMAPKWTRTEGEFPPGLIQRVFLDRTATLADVEANRTVKADAATRVFDVSCQFVNWAIVDSGVDGSHPAFRDHRSKDANARRVRASYDFTLVQRIKNFDLIESPAGGPERTQAIAKLTTDLAIACNRAADAEFLREAETNLGQIAHQLELGRAPDWNLVEPLIQVVDQAHAAMLVSDHGTHVAGILGADWRSDTVGPDGQRRQILSGVCPDIGLFDLRVIDRNGARGTEFAIIAALEYVQFVNNRAGSNGPILHGVNISMSIPHDVRNYGCGATPICVACDKLVSSGVIVVAAAGNRGWSEMEFGFGNYAYCSITDPGNAREVITVGGTHRVKPHLYGVSYFSSRGPTGDGRAKPDLVAPGEKVRGPIRGRDEAEMDGTSMAAPFVSGAAAMMLARNRELVGQPRRVKELLCNSATDLGRERYFQGHGLVDVLRALQSV